MNSERLDEKITMQISRSRDKFEEIRKSFIQKKVAIIFLVLLSYFLILIPFLIWLLLPFLTGVIYFKRYPLIEIDRNEIIESILDKVIEDNPNMGITKEVYRKKLIEEVKKSGTGFYGRFESDNYSLKIKDKVIDILNLKVFRTEINRSKYRRSEGIEKLVDGGILIKAEVGNGFNLESGEYINCFYVKRYFQTEVLSLIGSVIVWALMMTGNQLAQLENMGFNNSHKFWIFCVIFLFLDILIRNKKRILKLFLKPAPVDDTDLAKEVKIDFRLNNSQNGIENYLSFDIQYLIIDLVRIMKELKYKNFEIRFNENGIYIVLKKETLLNFIKYKKLEDAALRDIVLMKSIIDFIKFL